MGTQDENEWDRMDLDWRGLGVTDAIKNVEVRCRFNATQNFLHLIP